MKKKLITGGLVLAISLFGCQANNNDDDAARSNNNGQNVEQTRFQNNAGEGNANRWDYMMDRNADRLQTDRDNDGRNMNNVDRVNNNENRYNVDKEAADRIVNQVQGIKTAYVLTTDNNAYVAAERDNDNNNNNNDNDNNNNNNDNDNQNRNDNNDELSDEMKNEIGDIVRSVDNNIDNVYVSTNPDFFNLTNNYVEDVHQGRPVEGFFDQFGNMVQRIFPQNR
ncbi:hypothetical protein D8M04_08865 [Oceanobacillus piezotolerans]|uniref:YhcN/YlaJ family sporulation lipoprotein n=1 Tax=Oceanobacillus piezotolerans TaxID=2448030 RepID=A0A498DHK7_9BACI|nr:YhcN/YlaJ family sporulation lipoprotein [Oceanobacillus piezotolerans]RLL44975.1 hypothetical protein D8M04_08865 [Oceanobacillus piezotolerans]